MLTLEGHPVHGLTKQGRRVPEGVDCAVFSRDGKRLLTGGLDFTAKVWEVATGAKLLTLKGREDGILCAAFSPDD